MTYNVFGGTLNLAQSINPAKVYRSLDRVDLGVVVSCRGKTNRQTHKSNRYIPSMPIDMWG